MNMFKRAVNDLTNFLIKINKLSLKEKVYLLVFFVVLYFVVKMVMKQFVVTERFSLGELFNRVFGRVRGDKPTEEQIEAREAVASRMNELKESETEENAPLREGTGRRAIQNVYDAPYAPALKRPAQESPQERERSREKYANVIERFANRTKLMATLDKK